MEFSLFLVFFQAVTSLLLYSLCVYPFPALDFCLSICQTPRFSWGMWGASCLASPLPVAGMVVVFSQGFLDSICLAAFLFSFYADELSTMAVRSRHGENLLRPHRKHLYQLLANEKGISHWKISVGYGLVQLLVGISILLVKPCGCIGTKAEDLIKRCIRSLTHFRSRLFLVTMS